MTDPTPTRRAPLAERALSPARPRRAAVGHPALLRHPRDDGRRHQPRGGGAGLRHARARSSRRASRACARAGPTTRPTSAPSSCAARSPTHLERRYGVAYDPETEILDHRRRVGGRGPRAARDLRPGRRGHPPRAVVRRLRPGDRVRGRHGRSTSRPGSRTTSRSTRRPSRPRSRRGPRRCSWATRRTRPARSSTTTSRTSSRGSPSDHDLLVYSDEIYDRLAYGTYRHRAFSSLPGMRERTILMGGFSKAYAMTGWRVGYMCAPAGDPRGHRQGPPVRDHVGADGRPGRRAGGARRAASPRSRRWSPSTTAAAGCSSTASTGCGLETFEPRGAFYAFPRITSTGLTSDEFTERLLREEQVAVVPGSAFGPSGEGHVRMCYATAYEQLEEAVRRIAPVRGAGPRRARLIPAIRDRRLAFVTEAAL